MQKKYTHEERIQILKSAHAFVKSGQGTYTDFIFLTGISRATYYQWVLKYSDEAGVPVQGRKMPSNQKMIAIGKPQDKSVGQANHVTVSFYESKIDVGSFR